MPTPNPSPDPWFAFNPFFWENPLFLWNLWLPVTDVPPKTPPPPRRRLLLWMLSFLKPVKGYAALACFYLVVSILLEVMLAKYFGNAVDDIKALKPSGADGFFAWFFKSDESRPLRGRALLLVAISIAFWLFRYLREVARAKFSMNMVFYIRQGVYDKLQRVGFAFHDAMTTGQLINRALSDLQHCRMFIENALLILLEIALVVILYIGLLSTRSVTLALFALAPLPVWTIYILKFSKKVQPVAKSAMEAEDKTVSIITETIAGVHVVKAFAAEEHEIDKYQQGTETFYQRVMKRIGLYAAFTPVIRGIGTASHLLLFAAAGVLTLIGKLGAGDFVILATAMNALLTRLQQVSVINEQYQNAMVSAVRLFEVIFADSGIKEEPNAPALPSAPGGVEFEDVIFGYDLSRPVIEGIRFSAPPGSVTGIVGPTGSGKSTLMSLLSRFYDPSAGRILIGGFDHSKVSLESLRKGIAMVFQETYLFSDTVEANIRYGKPDIPFEKVVEAAKIAQAHDFILEMPKGYQTLLGERGASLSGGQRQRIAIARAILLNPDILVLDDATASVDPKTEDLIREGVRQAMKGKTIFIIAHRISAIRHADKVVVIENGKVSDQGAHRDLMARDGYYKRIAEAQWFNPTTDSDLRALDNLEAPYAREEEPEGI